MVDVIVAKAPFDAGPAVVGDGSIPGRIDLDDLVIFHLQHKLAAHAAVGAQRSAPAPPARAAPYPIDILG